MESATRRPTREEKADEPRPVNVDDISQRTVNSTTTVLTGPDGSIATVHLGWIVTIGPMDDESQMFAADDMGTLTDEDRALVEDGGYVLEHGCIDRDWLHVEADPSAVRGYAVASAANLLVKHLNDAKVTVGGPPEPAQTGTPDIHKAPSSQGAIPNTNVKPANDGGNKPNAGVAVKE